MNTKSKAASRAGIDQQAKPDQAVSTDNSIADIVVTANKREESTSKAGLTIKALSGAQLEQQHITTLADLSAAAPGLNYAQTENATPVYDLTLSAKY
jgi:iron complex outermembrane recepter protein